MEGRQRIQKTERETLDDAVLAPQEGIQRLELCLLAAPQQILAGKRLLNLRLHFNFRALLDSPSQGLQGGANPSGVIGAHLRHRSCRCQKALNRADF